MKKIIILSLLCAGIYSAKAQTIDTAYHYATACKIVPFKVTYSDSTNATHLSVHITYDDLKANCSVHYALMDDNGNLKLQGDAAIGGTAYQNWNGNNIFPFTFIGAFLKVTFQ